MKNIKGNRLICHSRCQHLHDKLPYQTPVLLNMTHYVLIEPLTIYNSVKSILSYRSVNWILVYGGQVDLLSIVSVVSIIHRVNSAVNQSYTIVSQLGRPYQQCHTFSPLCFVTYLRIKLSLSIFSQCFSISTLYGAGFDCLVSFHGDSCSN